MIYNVETESYQIDGQRIVPCARCAGTGEYPPTDGGTCSRCNGQGEHPLGFDGQRFPFVRDFDGMWHKRPADDRWIRSLNGPNARTICGQAIPSVHVSGYDPRENAELQDRETFCECVGPHGIDGKTQ